MQAARSPLPLRAPLYNMLRMTFCDIHIQNILHIGSRSMPQMSLQVDHSSATAYSVVFFSTGVDLFCI